MRHSDNIFPLNSGSAGHSGNISPELQQAIDNAKQDRVELHNAPPNLKAQCQEACKNSEAEVIRLGVSFRDEACGVASEY